MEEKCLCEPDEILVFSCSGSSNVGQIANLAGLRLTQDKGGRMYCLAGIGGHVSGMIESTKAAKMDSEMTEIFHNEQGEISPDLAIIVNGIAVSYSTRFNFQLKEGDLTELVSAPG